MIKVYGSHLWKDCKPVREALSAKNVEYEYLDISKNLHNLKPFLFIRDNSDEFKIIKERQFIGLPCIDDNGKIYVGKTITEYLEKL